jgi:2-dehydropantoate 2-reductase
VRENKESRELMYNLLNEIFNVSIKAGALVESDFVDKTMSYIDTYPYDAATSLARDIWSNKPSEIEYQNGTVAQLGMKFGVNVPVNTFVYHCLSLMERKARGIR